MPPQHTDFSSNLQNREMVDFHLYMNPVLGNLYGYKQKVKILLCNGYILFISSTFGHSNYHLLKIKYLHFLPALFLEEFKAKTLPFFACLHPQHLIQKELYKYVQLNK